jgi:glycosyltransferase involved in cell wall biosynthesis
MKAFFWAAGNDGGSFYRQTLPTTGLQWRGHQVAASTQMSLPAVRGADAVIGARIASPGATEAWRKLRSAGVPLILDLDDDYFAIDDTNARAHEAWNKDGIRVRLQSNMNGSDLITVVSEGLAERMREWTTTPVRVVPNLLPAQYLGAARVYRPSPVTVGWAGSSSTLHELPIIARALAKLTDLGRDIRVKLVGCTIQEANLMGVGGPHVTATGWVSTVPEYLKACMAFDIWVAPYRPTPFNQAKFATKALEAAFLGIPLLASDIRPYRDWVSSHGSECGVQLVKAEHEWGKYLRALTDPDVGDFIRQSAGHAGSSVAAQYVLQSGAERWEEVIQMAGVAARLRQKAMAGGTDD